MTQQFHLGISPKKSKTLIQKDRCSATCIAALFAIADVWKQPKCPSIDSWINKTWCMYTMEYYSAVKRMKFYHLQQ